MRDGDSCRQKFEKLANAPKPTGTSDIPLHVKRAKDIKEMISRDEVIGLSHSNDSGFEFSDIEVDGADEYQNEASSSSGRNSTKIPSVSTTTKYLEGAKLNHKGIKVE